MNLLTTEVFGFEVLTLNINELLAVIFSAQLQAQAIISSDFLMNVRQELEMLKKIKPELGSCFHQLCCKQQIELAS